jgi:hypothetical protein
MCRRERPRSWDIRRLNGKAAGAPGLALFETWDLPGLSEVQCRRTPPTTSCMSTPLLLSIHAAMKSPPAQVLPV